MQLLCMQRKIQCYRRMISHLIETVKMRFGDL